MSSGEHDLGIGNGGAAHTAETVKAAPYRGPSAAPGSGEYRAAQLEGIERARRDASLAPTFDKLVEATLSLASSSQSLQTEVKQLVRVTYALLGMIALGEAIVLGYALFR